MFTVTALYALWGGFGMPYEDYRKSTPKSGVTAPHVANNENFEILEGMAMNGATQVQMAEALGICKETLAKYYGDYLKSVKPLFDARVARQLKKNIFHDDPKIALDATKFYLNSKVGYKQSSDATLNGNVGLSLKVAFDDADDTPES